jgi:hypothetical protein
MDKVPWVGNGLVQLTDAQLWVGYGYSCQAQCRTLACTQGAHDFFFCKGGWREGQGM